METFAYSLKAEATKKQYTIYVKYFLNFANITVDELLTQTPEKITDTLISYVISMR